MGSAVVEASIRPVGIIAATVQVGAELARASFLLDCLAALRTVFGPAALNVRAASNEWLFAALAYAVNVHASIVIH
jgi:hypothetical protein